MTSRADVNIAAVNYHFGSKENLVNEVFRRRMDEMSDAPPGAAATGRSEHPGELEPILAAFVEPALALAQDRHGGGAFVRVMARAYAEKNDSLRKFLSDHYGHVLREFAKAIARLRAGAGQGGAVLAAGLPGRRADLRDGRLRPDQAARRRLRDDASRPGRRAN